MLDQLEVTDPRTVRALSSGRAARYLAPYFAGACSIAEAAEYLDEPMGRTHYWTRRWCELGALAVVAERTRPGRPIRIYRTVARQFVVAPEHLPQDHFDHVVAGTHRVLFRAIREAIGASEPPTMVVRQAPGQRGVSVAHESAPRAPESGRRTPSSDDSVHNSSSLQLDEAEAQELADELQGVLSRWSERVGDRLPGPGRAPHLVLVAMARTPAD
ncbi:hypothetical protein [Kytococcus sedentarius]|uniref:hypothetical protein n=1 Tax=Kytococcus sedentarius TaxID=1276 RepID=UPI0035BC48B8